MGEKDENITPFLELSSLLGLFVLPNSGEASGFVRLFLILTKIQFYLK